MSSFGMADVPAEFLMGIGTTLAGLENQLAVALAFQGDRAARLAALAGNSSLLVQFPHDAGWGLITADRFEFGRKVPAAPAAGPSRTFVELLADDAVRSAIAVPVTGDPKSPAGQMVHSLIKDDRRAFRRLAEFSPIVEPIVYSLIGHAITALDQMRPMVQQSFEVGPKDGDRLPLTYLWLISVLERATLISTDAGSKWLADLAGSFTWIRWTPGFALTRERTLWGTLIGARAASRFGPSVIDPYLEALERARHPMVALDAVIGLTAIGIRHPEARDAVIAGLESASPGMAERGLLETEAVVQGQLHSRLLLTGSTKAGTLQFAGTRRDAFELDAAGQMRAFALMPAAIDNPAWRFIPSETELRPSPARIARELFTRAWGPAERRPRTGSWQPAGNA